MRSYIYIWLEGKSAKTRPSKCQKRPSKCQKKAFQVPKKAFQVPKKAFQVPKKAVALRRIAVAWPMVEYDLRSWWSLARVQINQGLQASDVAAAEEGELYALMHSPRL